MTRRQLQQRLDESLTPEIPGVDDRANVVVAILDRYRPPTSRRARWIVSDTTPLTEPGPTASTVWRDDDSADQAYTDNTADRVSRAHAVARALNALEAELFGTAGGTAG
jgi:hypothetical protein